MKRKRSYAEKFSKRTLIELTSGFKKQEPFVELLLPLKVIESKDRAEALARLNRARDAMAALRRAIELDEELLDGIEEEEHLKSLARLPEFRKLITGDDQEKKK